MTVGIAVKCMDGIVVACDSLSTSSKGVPIATYANKVHIIDHDRLLFPVAVTSAGSMAFVDKFLSRCNKMLDLAPEDVGQLDIESFTERVCETVCSILFKEYVIDRHQFFGMDVGSIYSLSLIAAGATEDGEPRAYIVHSIGLAELIHDCGTIGSGAAYAELFMRQLIPDLPEATTERAACLAAYAIKGVDIMDPYVGGAVNVCTLRMAGDEFKIELLPDSKMPVDPGKRMEEVLDQMGDNMRSLVSLILNEQEVNCEE